MKTVAKSAGFLAAVLLLGGLVAFAHAQGPVVKPQQQGESIKKGKSDPPTPSPATRVSPKKEPGTTVMPLTFGECLRVGGSITVDDACPFTVSNTTGDSTSGRTISGRFRCKAKGSPGKGACIDESG
jgi:hypothetical protein